MLETSIRDLCKHKDNSYNIYFHNFANFESIFLIKILNRIEQIKPIIHKGKIISITLIFTINNKQYKLHFKDSYQILLSSLHKLSQSFLLDEGDRKSFFLINL